MNKKVFIALLLASHAPLVAHDNNFYAGLAVGGGILNVTQTVGQEIYGFQVPFIENKTQYDVNAEANIVATWAQRRQNVVFGVNGDIGWGFQKATTSGSDPTPIPEAKYDFLVSKLERGFNLSAMGFLGYAMGTLTCALKAGFVGANFKHRLQEIDGGVIKSDNTQSYFAPGLGGGAFLERTLGNITLRLDYTCAVYETSNKNSESDAETKNLSKLQSPIMHRVMSGVLWKI